MCQASDKCAEKYTAEIHNSFCDACVVHKNTGADEKGDRKKWDTLCSGNDTLHEYSAGQIWNHEEVGYAAGQYGDKDRHFEK